ncbi:cytochrome C assembly family protein [Teredinibacter haidensis]|uniref:cytochrome C assembly family protein n=1 Tax=Teredinibacter haidensis TaxID=2731755 RepID=UPI000949055E|nr:cytochrome c biogenesis protein CcsA [Teredinibacter haidensis]
MFSVTTILFYLAAWAFLLHSTLRREDLKEKRLLAFIALGTLAHFLAAFVSIRTETAYQFGFFKVPSLFFAVINLVVLISSIRKPLHNLFLFLLPLSVAAILVSGLEQSVMKTSSQLSLKAISHILLSILAYSLLTIASLQALLLSYQNYQLKHKHLRGVMGLLPPLQTMETLLFELVWAGEILLTLSIITGFLFTESFAEQHLSHKAVFSMISWLIYALLLWGRHTLGWRGAAAIRWTLGGFAALMLAYFGSKLVLEIILGRV